MATRKRGTSGRFVATKRRAPTRARKARGAAPAVIVNTPPARRRVARRAGPVTVKRRYLRRRGGGSGGMQIGNLLTNAAVGAVGAIGVDFVYRMLPIPHTMQVGITGAAIKGVATVGLGMLAERALPKHAVTGAVTGALTVQLHALINSLIAPHALRPGAGLSEVDDMGDIDDMGNASLGFTPDEQMDDMGMYVSETDTIGEYVS